MYIQETLEKYRVELKKTCCDTFCRFSRRDVEIGVRNAYVVGVIATAYKNPLLGLGLGVAGITYTSRNFWRRNVDLGIGIAYFAGVIATAYTNPLLGFGLGAAGIATLYLLYQKFYVDYVPENLQNMKSKDPKIRLKALEDLHRDYDRAAIPPMSPIQEQCEIIRKTIDMLNDPVEANAIAAGRKISLLIKNNKFDKSSTILAFFGGFADMDKDNISPTIRESICLLWNELLKKKSAQEIKELLHETFQSVNNSSTTRNNAFNKFECFLFGMKGLSEEQKASFEAIKTSLL